MREKQMTELNQTRGAEDRIQFESSETLPAMRHSWNSSGTSQTGDDPQQALLWQDRHHEKVNGVHTVPPPLSIPAVPRVTYSAPWPTIFDQFMHYFRPSSDIYVVMSIIVFLSTSEAKGDSFSLWGLYRSNGFLFLGVPFMIRFCHGFLHFILSVPILPGQIIFHEGPLLRIMPKFILDATRESSALREMCRPRLQQMGGFFLQLTCPDGMVIDAVYFRGDGASLNGPTVIRFNGNAEAFELQEEALIRLYNSKGLNFIMFNFRGVGRSRCPKRWNSDAAGYFVNLWTTPSLNGVVLDSWTVLSYVVAELRVPPAHVILAGHSIGAAVATRLAAAHPAWPAALCNSRSFASLRRLAIDLAPALFGLAPGGNGARWLRRLARAVLWASGWELNSLSCWDRVPGYKWLEFSTDDHIIPYPHSLHAALVARAPQPQQPAAAVGSVGAAAGPAQVGASASALRAMQMMSLDGIDNHNRSLLEFEAAQHIAFVLEAVRRGPDAAAAAAAAVAAAVAGSPAKVGGEGPSTPKSGGSGDAQLPPVSPVHMV